MNGFEWKASGEYTWNLLLNAHLLLLVQQQILPLQHSKGPRGLQGSEGPTRCLLARSGSAGERLRACEAQPEGNHYNVKTESPSTEAIISASSPYFFPSHPPILPQSIPVAIRTVTCFMHHVNALTQLIVLVSLDDGEKMILLWIISHTSQSLLLEWVRSPLILDSNSSVVISHLTTVQDINRSQNMYILSYPKFRPGFFTSGSGSKFQKD